MSSNNDSVTNSSSEHWTGRVKWFNNKAGYGFITITDGSRSGSDIFVHHSVINVENQQYKYLVQGEYVEFDMVRIESTQHEWQASNVSGIRGGKLMCETRRELKSAKDEYKITKSQTQKEKENTSRETIPHETTPRENVLREKPNRNNQAKQRPARRSPDNETDKKEWTVVGKKKPSDLIRQKASTNNTIKK
jgi:CspA family cold shock protein